MEVKTEETIIAARVERSDAFKSGTPAHFALNGAMLHVFDAESGNRLN